MKEFHAEINLDELFERLLFIKRVEAGLAAADADHKVPQAKVEAHYKRKWWK